MVKEAEELVEPVLGGQKFVLVAQVVLAELTGGVAQRLQQLGDGGIFVLQADIGSRHPHLAQAGAEDALAGDEGRTPRGAALLAVTIGEHDSFVGDAVDIRRLVAHHAVAVGADVPHADVIAPDDQNVRFLFCCHRPSFWGAIKQLSRLPVTLMQVFSGMAGTALTTGKFAQLGPSLPGHDIS